MRRCLTVTLSALTVIGVSAADAIAVGATSQTEAPARIYQVDYLVTPKPALGGVTVVLTLRQPQRLLRELDMALADIDVSSVTADGDWRQVGNRLVWHPPAEGGTLSWFTPVNHMRSQGAYDAYMHSAWALFRNDDIIPSARTRTLRGARSNTHLKFKLPHGWSSTTQYFGRNENYPIDNPHRRFDQPTGWVLLGKLGIRNEDIDGTRVKVAGPVGHSVRRMDMLALLHWTLPELRRILPDFPRRLTIVSAADPMWRGGLSAPASLFIHAGLPLISENATSPLLHEVLHIGLGIQASDGADWIIEGLAEYYGLELLRRSHSISTDRHAAAIAGLRKWGADVTNLCKRQSTGNTTARATVIFYELNQELQQHEKGKVSYDLDDLLHELKSKNRRVSVRIMQEAATQLHGSLPKSLEIDNLPGCIE